MTATIVAIDGPAGAGKSTLARRLAEELDLPYVNTGLMYRALAKEALRRGLDPGDGPALAALLGDIRFDLDSSLKPPALVVESVPPGPEVLDRDVESVVSAVARHPEVRTRMAAEQRRLGAGGAVMEGRDIGTVVFPGATVKIFLQATPDERASRRRKERTGQPGVERELAARDARDATVNPFVPAGDAVAIDTTGRSPHDVFREALALVRERLGPG